MPTFRYEASRAGGETAKGVVEALNQNDAVSQIKQNYDVVLSIKEVPTGYGEPKAPSATLGKVSFKSLSMSCKQFAIILKAGLPLIQSVEMAATQTSDKKLAQLFRQVSEDVAGGWSLSYSFEQRAPYLPVTFRETVRAGEESGDLIKAFERLAEYYGRAQKTRAKTINTLIYPIIVIIVAIGVVAIIMGYAMPVFTDIFLQLDIELPAVTKLLIAASEFFQQWILVIVMAIAGVALALWGWGRTERGALALAKLRLGIPVIGGIAKMASASQFAHTMSAMLTAGMSILQAIDVSGRAMDNRVMSKEVLDTLPGVESGKSFGECLEVTGQEMPHMLTQMVIVGESSGSMEDTLSVVADYYDNELDVQTERALAMIEPIIIVCLSVFVVIILLAVYVPMFSMYQNI